jgi:DNA-binding NtrC family response regulator/tetratricopeptide (TPR) repeat protein
MRSIPNKTRDGAQLPSSSASPTFSQESLARAEALYRAGLNGQLLNELADLGNGNTDANVTIRLKILEGMATFDLGDVVASLRLLREAVELARQASVSLRFSAALALFLRETDFQAPEEALPGLSSLRQLASSIGDANSLAGLHLGVARLEGLRGHCLNAHRHLEIARRFADRCDDVALCCCVDNIEASLQVMAGNLGRSRRLAEACFDRADVAGFAKYRLGAIANLAAVELYSGNLIRAESLLGQVLEQANGLTYVQLGALDSLAAIELRRNNLSRCLELLERCSEVAKADVVPAPSWNDLAHEVTRCAYLEQHHEWLAVVGVVTRADTELERRQYKSLRVLLLCAKARALARMNQQDPAQQALATAVGVCPRGAVDAAIVLDATKALCLSLRGEENESDLHYDRAIAACRAIGHQYHNWWIERDRQEQLQSRKRVGAFKRRERNLAEVALQLSDVTGIVRSGTSIDLLVHRVVSILEATSLRDKIDVSRQAGREYHSKPVVTWSSDPKGTFLVRLQCCDSDVSLQVRGTGSLEELVLLKSLVTLLQISARDAAETEAEDEELGLWPRQLLAGEEDTVFRSPRMTEILRVAERLAATNLPILLTGETGTGKEVLARLIHERSRVSRGPFQPFNCSAVPRELAESQLFGHRRGAFTGAVDSFPGFIRAAEHGTLFLDELGDLDLTIQPKFLRFLESGEVHPVGELRAHRSTVRVIAATNHDLDALVAQGRFRRDLFYRIGGAQIELPPLRERKDEIPALASLFLTRYAKECSRSALKLGDDFIAALLLYDWPGNIRQLSHEIRRATAMAADGHKLTAADLGPEIARTWCSRPVPAAVSQAARIEIGLDQPLASAVEELERKFIEHALQISGGRVTEAAQLLGLSRKGLFLKRRRRGFLES